MHSKSDPPQCCQIHHKLKASPTLWFLFVKATRCPGETQNIKQAFTETAEWIAMQTKLPA